MKNRKETNLGITKSGDLVQLVGLTHKSFIFNLIEGGELHTHRGMIKHDELIGKKWGTQVFSHNNSPFFLLQPTTSDILKNTKRATQIMYPKEISYILLYMGIRPNCRVIEAGTGSGSFTTAMALAIGNEGKIYSYEIKEATQAIAKRSIEKLNLSTRVEFKVRDIEDGFDEENVDAVFLDVSNPYDYLPQVRKSLKAGGHFGSILPTMNQVTKLLIALRQNNFAFIEVCDITQRYYKTEPSRFRPTDRMISHTGYLIFARPVIIDREKDDYKLIIESGLLSLEDIELIENKEGYSDL